MKSDEESARMRRAATIAVAVGAILVLVAGGTPLPSEARALTPQGEPDSSAITPAMIDAGRAIFHGKGMCFACHGPQLQGTQVAPTLKAHAWRDAKKGEFPAIFFVVTHGVSGTLMVAFPGGISRPEALSAASYVWSVGQGKAKP